MTDKQGLGGEGIGLDVHIGSGHLTQTTGRMLFIFFFHNATMITARRQRGHVSAYLVDETGLANIGITTKEQGSCVGVDGGQTRQMLTH